MIKLELNKNLIEDFHNNGFLILEKFINLEYLNKLIERFKPLFQGFSPHYIWQDYKS